jgi:glycerate-2-kinase
VTDGSPEAAGGGRDENLTFAARVMNRKGVEFSLLLIEPGWWKWRFQIGETVSTGKTQTNLMGIAAHRVQQWIDHELKKPRDLKS